MQIISQVKHEDTTINFMIKKQEVGYSFEFEGKSYGHKTELKSKKRDELVAVVAILTINALESYKAIKENNDKATN